MVRIASSILGVAVVFSGLSRAAPTKRQDITPVVAAPAAGGDITPVVAAPAAGGDISPVVPVVAGDITPAVPAAGAGAADGSLSSIDLSGVDTNVPQASGSLGNSVEFPTAVSTVDATSTSVAYTSTSSTVMATETPVVIPPVSSGNSYNYPIYGSGSSGWQSNYNTCVQTCFAQYPPPPTTVSLPSVEQAPISGSVSSGSSSGSGTVWNIAVAPVKGVFRFVPPFVNAAPGDTIRYTWANGPHTVTQSSGLTPCNATVAGFVSGKQEAGFTFDQAVNDTAPVWFFCSVAKHCASGMFGAINAPTGGADSNTTVAALMPQWAAANADIASAWNATSVLAASTPGLTWGDKIDLGSVDPALHAGIAQSILYTRAVIAENKDMVGADGVFRPQKDLKLPADVSALLADADSGSPAGAQNAATGAGPTAAADAQAAAASQAPETNGAGSIVSSRAAVAAVALLAALLAF